MKKKNKQTSKFKKFFIIGIVFILILISYFGFTFTRAIILYSPVPSNHPTDFCRDSDAKTINQYNVAGNVIYIYRRCSLLNLNKPDSTTGDFCAYALNYNDNCMTTITLMEKICLNNKVSSMIINCPNGCVNGKCV